jgi:hypothetical protein
MAKPAENVLYYGDNLDVLRLHVADESVEREEAASAGFYKSPWGQHSKIQLLTVAELLEGKRIDMPASGSHMTQVALPPTPEAAVHPDQLGLGE